MDKTVKIPESEKDREQKKKEESFYKKTFLLYCRQKVCEIFTIFAPEMLTEYR